MPIFSFCVSNVFVLMFYIFKVATIARPPLDTPAKKGNSSSTGYIVSIFRVFEGDDREKLERNWLYWTGSFLYCFLLHSPCSFNLLYIMYTFKLTREYRNVILSDFFHVCISLSWGYEWL